MTNYQSGHDAEQLAAKYLQAKKFKIRDLNWKTPACEIDIVAEKDKTIWFVEVKYRKTSRQGFGYEYVTPRKLQQMSFAAEMWVHEQHWTGPYRLAVMSLDNDQVTLIDDI